MALDPFGTPSPLSSLLTVDRDAEAPEDFEIGRGSLILTPGNMMVNIPVPRISADAETIILITDAGSAEFPVSDFPFTDNGDGTLSLNLTADTGELGDLATLRVAAADFYHNQTDPVAVTWAPPVVGGSEVDCSEPFAGLCSQGGIPYPFYFRPENATTFEIILTTSDPPEFVTPGAVGSVNPASGNIADIIGQDGRARVTWTSGEVGLDNVRFTVIATGADGRRATQIVDISQE